MFAYPFSSCISFPLNQVKAFFWHLSFAVFPSTFLLVQSTSSTLRETQHDPMMLLFFLFLFMDLFRGNDSMRQKPCTPFLVKFRSDLVLPFFLPEIFVRSFSFASVLSSILIHTLVNLLIISFEPPKFAFVSLCGSTDEVIVLATPRDST
jgi:hypothetical protein